MTDSVLAPDADAFLRYLASLAPPALETLTVPEVRQLVRGWRQFMGPAQPVGAIADHVASGPGGPLTLRSYQPLDRGSACLPVLVYLHGGGWVTGDLEMVDPLCRALANQAGVVVVSVAYRLAPEAPFPAAVDDAHAALRWAQDHAVDLGGDPDRLAVGGDSAGGNLAASVALVARDRGGPPLGYQILLYPACDAAMDTESYRANGSGYLLDAQWMEWFWRHYLAGQCGTHPYASPLRAPDLRHLPPAFVATVEFDPLRDEGEAYAARLAEAGVGVEVHRIAGQIHGIAWLNGVIGAGDELINQAAAALRRTFP